MRTKLKVISLFLLLTVMSVIIFIGFLIRTYSDYLIAIPKISGNRVSIEAIEDINEIMLTYENMYDKTVKALKSNFNVVLKGTNYTYHFIMNYSIIKGGFFTKEAFENKNKVAVVNKKAAFNMYGTLNVVGNELEIDMVPYLVMGVIDDNDNDNLNIFIPATCLDETTEIITTNLSNDNGLTEEYVKNELKHIGITELKYDFLNISLIIKVIKDKIFLSFEIISFGLIIVAIRKIIIIMVNKWNKIRQQQQHFYTGEVLRSKDKPIQKLIFFTVLIIAMIISEFLLFINIFEKLLNWNKGVFIKYTRFEASISQIEKIYTLSNILFVVFILSLAVFIVTTILEQQ